MTPRQRRLVMLLIELDRKARLECCGDKGCPKHPSERKAA